MKITCYGSYGFANYGDDLFNLATALAARRWWSGHDVDILGPRVPGIEANFRVWDWFPPSLYTAPGFAGKMSRLSFLAAAMLTRDLLLYAGGSTLSYGSIIKKVQRLAAERGMTKFAAIGVSLGPFAGAADEAEAARFCKKFTYFTVRDQKSAAWLERMGMPFKPLLARDLVGALPRLLPPNESGRMGDAPPNRPTLGISLCHYERLTGGDTIREERRMIALFEGIARFAQREGVLVRIFCLNAGAEWGDAGLSRELLDYLIERGVEVESISAEGNLLGCWYGLGACTAVLSVRLHGAVTAYLCDVPFVLVEYHVKCTDFLEDIGQPAEVRIGPDLADPLVVDQILERLFHQRVSPAFPREAYIADAARNFTQVPWVTAPA